MNILKPGKKAEYAAIVRLTGTYERPEAGTVYVIDWPDAGIVIPWPEGLSAREAVKAWGEATKVWDSALRLGMVDKEDAEADIQRQVNMAEPEDL